MVWGLANGARPTSEMPSHVACHAVRAAAVAGRGGGGVRVLYHAHATSVVALTSIVPCDARLLTRLLWKSFSESLIAIPGGVGAVPWMPPGSVELADATAQALGEYEACIWQLHGVFASGATCDAAFGLVAAVDKAADAYLRARAACGGAEPANLIPDEGLAAMAAAYNLPVNTAFLEL